MFNYYDPHRFTLGGVKIQRSRVLVGDVNLHVVDYGGRGETILCVHGLSGTARWWDGIAELLVDQFRVIAFDVRGRGDSDKPLNATYDIYRYADDTAALMDVLGLEKVIYMGHSMGATVGVIMANTHPERLSRLVLVDGGTPMTQELMDALRPTFARLGQASPDLETYARGMLAQYYGEASEGIRSFVKCTSGGCPSYDGLADSYALSLMWHNVHHNPDGSVVSKCARHAIQPEAKSRPVDVGELGPRIRVPTLLLHAPGGFSVDGQPVPVMTKHQAEALARTWPLGSASVEIAGANHLSIMTLYRSRAAYEVRCFLLETKR